MTTVFAALVLAAAMACPAHMWWRQRRGADPCCLPSTGTPDAEDLRARQLVLSRQLEALAGEGADASERPAGRG